MKTKFISFALVLFGSFLNAQITLEHHKYPTNVKVSRISSATWVYYYTDTNNIYIYDKTHALINSFAMPKVNKYSFNDLNFVSTNLFNTDSKFEYALTLNNDTNFYNSLFIYNENGIKLFQYDTLNGSPKVVDMGSDGIKMLLTKGGYGQFIDVFSLGGNYVGMKKISNDDLAGPAFPNPSSNYIHLPYVLPQGNATGDLIIADLSGKVVQKVQVGNVFNEYLLDVNSFNSGEYIYYINASGNQSAAKKIIVQK